LEAKSITRSEAYASLVHATSCRPKMVTVYCDFRNG